MSNLPVATNVFTPSDETKILGAIQFVHGMAEHKERYREIIKFFNDNGFVCAISDLRGHGVNINSDKDFGYIGKQGDLALIEDVHTITKYLKNTYPNLPYFLIGHSMGSLIVRSYAKMYDNELDGLFVIGSPSDTNQKGLAKFMIKGISLFKGDHYRSTFINKLALGSFEAKFMQEGNKNAWLSVDRRVWDAYNNDRKCGFVFTLDGFSNLINLTAITYSKKCWAMNNPALPITFLSGEDDPCMINRQGFDNAVQIMKDVGYTNVQYKIYKGKRHEILNDFDKEQVYQDILKILDGLIK